MVNILNVQQHGGPQIDMWDGTRNWKVGHISNPAPETFHEMTSPASSRSSGSTLRSISLQLLRVTVKTRDIGLALVLAAPISLIRIALIVPSSILLLLPIPTVQLHHLTSVTIPPLSGAVSARYECHPKHGHLQPSTKLSWRTRSIQYRRC